MRKNWEIYQQTNRFLKKTETYEFYKVVSPRIYFRSPKRKKKKGRETFGSAKVNGQRGKPHTKLPLSSFWLFCIKQHTNSQL